MMKRTQRYLLFMSIFLLVYTTQCDAQIWKRVQKRMERRAQQKVEDKINKEADKTVDEAMDPVLDGDGNKKDDERAGYEKQKQANDMIAKMMGSSDVILPDQYDFDLAITYQITTNDDQSMFKYLLTDKLFWGFESIDRKDKMTMVIDQKRDVAIMFQTDNKGKKTGMKLPNQMGKDFLAQDSESAVDMSTKKIDIKRTGKKKKILNYICELFIVTTEEGISEMWVTKDLTSSITSLFGRSMKKNKNTTRYTDALKMIDGTFLEITYKDHKHTKNNSHILATDVDKDPSPIRTADYEWNDI